MDHKNPVETYILGPRIREARKALGLRQTDLSEITGLPTSHLSDIERGTLIPTIPTLRKLSQALDRSLEYFLQDENKPRSLGMVIHRISVGGQAAAKFAQLVEEKTGGEIKLHLYQRAVLGTAREQLEGLAEGAIHIYIDEPLSFERYAPLCGLVFLPYFFRDRDHYTRFFGSPLFEEQIFQKLLDNGIRLLNPVSNWEGGSFELLFSTEPIFTPDDLAGRKFRSYASDTAVALRQILGTDPVVVEWEQIYKAFEQGVIDTLLSPAAYFYSLEFHKLAKYATLLDYGYTLNLFVAMSEREYRKLPPTVQQILIEAIEETGQYCTELANRQTVVDLKNLSTEGGVSVIHPAPHDWRRRFDEAIDQICDQNTFWIEVRETLAQL